MRYGHDAIADIAALPELRKNAQVHYEGSIDKQGGNADWDWWLYQDEKGEWVIFEAFGPGCLYNFVQHRYLSSTDPLFRFYFDGEAEPRFQLHASEFGSKYPFAEPLAGRYIGPVDGGRGPIRVIRGFVPMPFTQSLKITSDTKLEGFNRQLGHGGWGHVIWHSYSENPGIKSFDGSEDYGDILAMLKRTGGNPAPEKDIRYSRVFDVVLPSGRAVPIHVEQGEGVVRAIRLKLRDFAPWMLEKLWFCASWDGHEMDVCCPIGCLFGNELGLHTVRYLMMGLNVDGEMYNFFPMPYWEQAEVHLENRSDAEVVVDYAEVGALETPGYHRQDCGYFCSSAYYPRTHTEGADSIIARLKGRGHVVAAVVTAHGRAEGEVTCEGDVRVHIDGILTPQVESDGSESYSCYGWGFPTPPECNPFSGYDGKPNSPWSMVRTMLADVYPFRQSLVFGIESGGCNDQYLEHSGIVFYYGQSQAAIRLTDQIDLKDEACRVQHNLFGTLRSETMLTSFYEGDDDDIEVSDGVVTFDGALEFTCALEKANSGLRLRRRSDQIRGRQAARVWVDGKLVQERIWYYADRNSYKRWLDDEFEIAAKYTRGKDTVRIRIEPFDAGNGITWNQARYQVYSLLD